MTVAQIKKLAREAEKAAKIASRNRFLIETYLSLLDYKAGRVKVYPSARAITRAAKRIR